MNDKVLLIYEFLYSRHQKSTLTINDFAEEENVCYQSISIKIKEGNGIPNYIRIGTSNNSKILFNLFDTALFIAGEAQDNINQSETFLSLHLHKYYQKSTLTINDIAKEMGVTYGTALNYYKQGLLPKSRRRRKGKITFNIVDFAKFLANTIKTV